MTDNISLHKGLDIPIAGKAEYVIRKTVRPDIFAVKPTDFKGIIPKLLVKEGDIVKAGTPIFCDKYRPAIKFTSPVSGVVNAIVRGEKRKLLEIRIAADKEIRYLKFITPNPESMNRDQILQVLLDSGLWPAFIQRPYGIVANPEDKPRDIFISGFKTAPIAADLSYTLSDDINYIQVAVNLLNKLTDGSVHLSLSASDSACTPLHKLENVKFHTFKGKHPAGNVGVQIANISPIGKGDIIWTIEAHLLATIGKLFKRGIVDFSRVIAIAGPRALSPSYIRGIGGSHISLISGFIDKDNKLPVRYISGDILTGENIGEDGFLGFYDDQITLISEGKYYEMLGWANPLRLKKFSTSRAYFSWLMPWKKYNMDSNLNGGERAFVVNGIYEKVLPMDIYIVYLMKAILAEDIDKMEQLGIYEVIEEDVALCEYICPSKIEFQSILRRGIDLMIKEMA